MKFLHAGLSTLMSAFLASSFAAANAQTYPADKSGLVEAVHDYKINGWWESILVDRMFDYRLAPACWKKMTEKDGWGIKCTANSATAFGEYMKAKGWGDLEASESANNNDRNNNKARVEQMIDEAKGKLHFTLVADKVSCTDAEWDLIHRMWTTPFDALNQGTWKPKNGDIFLTFTFLPTAKDISVTVAPDGKHFSVTAPTLTEPEAWDDKIVKGLNRAASAK